MWMPDISTQTVRNTERFRGSGEHGFPNYYVCAALGRRGKIMRCNVVFVALFWTGVLAVYAEARGSELEHELYRELHRGPQRLSPLPEPTVETRACYERLAKIGYFVAVSAHPDPVACSFGDLVRLDHVTMPDKTKVTISPPATLRCATAEGFAHFIRDDLAPAAADFAAPLASLSGIGSFECRKRNGDASGKLRDGKLIDLIDPRAPRSFLEKTRALACSRFTTVLGPGSDAAHNGHIHLDLLERPRGYRICQWTIPSAMTMSVETPMPRPRPRNNK
jgi:hypothetical protein